MSHRGRLIFTLGMGSLRTSVQTLLHYVIIYIMSLFVRVGVYVCV